MSAVLSEAETKFFSSGGQEVDASLKPAETPPEPAKPPLAAVPTPAPAVTPTPATEPPAPQQVPLTALHEERRARQQAEKDRQQLQQQIQQFQQTIEQLQKPQPPAPPDPQQDPIGAMLHQNQVTQDELKQFKEWRSQQDQMTQHIMARQQFQNAVGAAETAFRAKTPDYDVAYKYALSQYDKMLQRVIPDPAQRQQRLMQEALGAVWTVMQQGGDPAEFIYNFAKDMGYTGPQPAVVPTVPIAQTVPAVPVQPTSEVVKTIEKGLRQQGNPGGGGSPNSEITPEMALALPGDEFNKWWTKQFRR